LFSSTGAKKHRTRENQLALSLRDGAFFVCGFVDAQRSCRDAIAAHHDLAALVAVAAAWCLRWEGREDRGNVEKKV
jgi:hypothetical protein